MSEQRDLGEFFDAYAGRWDAAYADRARSFDYLNRQRLLLELVEELLPRPGRVLELGCGAGHTALRLAALGHQVTCLDVSARMIDAARANAEKAGVTLDLHVGTIHDLPADARDFDLIVAAGVMDYVTDRVPTLWALRERLVPGGAVALSFTNTRSPIYWVEVPPKRALALGAWAVTRNRRWRDIAIPASRGDSPEGVQAELLAGGLAFERFAFYTYGVRMGPVWWPPLWLVERAEEVVSKTPLASLGRGFFAVARRRP